MLRKQGKSLVFLLVLIAAVMLVPFVKAKAAGSLEVTEIDYDEETLTVKSPNSVDSYLYYSDSKMKTWECASGKFNEDGSYVLDISWVKKTKDYVLTLKGNVSDEVVSVTLPMQNKSLKVKYNYLTEQFVPEGDQGRPLFWRKADSTDWSAVDTTTAQIMRRLYAKGATIYLRTGSEEGKSAKNVGARPSKEVKVSLKKQTAAPSLSMKTPGVLTVNTTYEYQIKGDNVWTACKEKTLKLGEIATKAFYNGTTKGEDVDIYVRVAATEKKLPSASATVTVRAQESKEDMAIIELSYKNAATVQLTFTEKMEDVKDETTKQPVMDENGEVKQKVVQEKPSSKNPYEYTVVNSGEQLKPDATWTSITSSTVSISAEKAPTGSIVYVRKKGRLESKLVYQPESLAWNSNPVAYPAGSSVALVDNTQSDAVKAEIVDSKIVAIHLVKEQGKAITENELRFQINVAAGFEGTKVSSITCGNKEIKFSQTATVTGTAISVAITDTAVYEESITEFDKDQPLKITLTNGEVLADKVTLKVLRGAYVKVKKTFEVTHRIATNQVDYVFELSPGGLLTGLGADGKPTQYTDIAKIAFRGYDLSATDWEKELTDGSLKVTVHERAFDKAFEMRDTETDKEYPLIITMNNGQEIKSGVSVKLYEDAKITSTSKFIVASITSPLSAETKIELEFECKNSNDYIVSAMWNNSDIKGSIEGNSGKVIVRLDPNKINGLGLPEGESGPVTYPVVFTLQSGGIVSLAYSLTLTP